MKTNHTASKILNLLTTAAAEAGRYDDACDLAAMRLGRRLNADEERWIAVLLS